ncbi:MAG: RodZ domain-containing protein [Acidobacteriota bacterium]
MKNKQLDEENERSEDSPRVAEPESFGTWLRRQREVREIDLREIADSTKVSMSYLQAFEEDRFGVLPSPVFAKGFLRQYARYVGLDPEEVVNFYLAARHPEGEAEPSLQPRTVPDPPSRNYILIALAVIALLALLVWLLSAYNERSQAPAISAAPTPTPTREAPQTPAAQPVETAPVASPNEVDTPPSEAQPEPEVVPSEQASEPVPPLRVTLDFISDCWVEAAIDGVKRHSELRVQGESLLLDAEEVVEFKIGDVSAVQVEVNGAPFTIEHRSGTAVRSVRIDLATVAAIATSDGL